MRTPRAREPKVKGPFTLTPHSRRLCGSSRGGCARDTVSYCCCKRTPPELMQECHADLVFTGIFAIPKPPEARAGFLGELSEEGGTPTPLTAFTQGQREVLRAQFSGKGLYFGVLPWKIINYMLTPSCEQFSSSQDRRRHAWGPSAKGAAGVGYPLLPS